MLKASEANTKTKVSSAQWGLYLTFYKRVEEAILNAVKFERFEVNISYKTLLQGTGYTPEDSMFKGAKNDLLEALEHLGYTYTDVGAVIKIDWKDPLN